MTLLEKINNLTWYDLINKLKDILKGLAGQMSMIQTINKKEYSESLELNGLLHCNSGLIVPSTIKRK